MKNFITKQIHLVSQIILPLMSTFSAGDYSFDSRPRAALLEQQYNSTPVLGDYNQYYSEYTFRADVSPENQIQDTQDNSPLRIAIRNVIRTAINEQERQNNESNERQIIEPNTPKSFKVRDGIKKTVDPSAPKPPEVRDLFDWKWWMIIVILFDVRD